MAVDHYENFPVASVLLPRRLRRPVANIYRFARSADDIADEGDASAAERLERLSHYRRALEQLDAGRLGVGPTDLAEVFEPLTRTIAEHDLPLQPFHDLLSAFEQDVRVSRYEDDEELFAYCRLSANPVGRLMLCLYQRPSKENVLCSDAICTGLQLVNFWQDVAIDWQKKRLYLPRQTLRHHGVTEDYIAELTTLSTNMAQSMPSMDLAVTRPGPAAYLQDPRTRAWQATMREQTRQAREMLISGLPLTRRLPGRIGFELKLVVLGGLRILERLDQLHYDIFFQRPTLNKRDWVLLLWRALGTRQPEQR